MRFDVTQQLRLQQQMKLSPRIIQAMEILQLPMLALQARIDAELMSNPVLELQMPSEDEQPAPREEEPPDRGEKAMVVEENSGQGEDFERLSQFTDEYGMDFINSESLSRPRAATGERDRKMDAMSNAPAPDQSLREYLLEQLRFTELDERIIEAGRLVIDHVDDDGYVRTPLEEILSKSENSMPMQTLLAGLRFVQSLEPIGIGARDLKECLTIQLSIEAKAGRDVGLELTLVQRFLRDIEMNRLPKIARKIGRDIDEIKKAIENISHLNPRPGSLISSRVVPIIKPDIIVDIDDNGQVVVAMADGSTSNLRISQYYQSLVKNRQTDKDTKTFLRDNIRSAKWLVSAILQRRSTLHRVAEEVFRLQRNFLDEGESALKPLPMADIAEKISVHVATISRAVSGKYVQTPRGIYPLRMFFTSGTTTADGQDIAWDVVKIKLKELVAAEDKSKPLNDDKLAEELQKHGLKIARRTVAKYRGLMDIPPARRRREF